MNNLAMSIRLQELVVLSRDVLSSNSGYISLDNGLTFSHALDTTNGIDFVDDLHGVVTGFNEQIWSRTTDGGITWKSISPADTFETWSVYAVKNTSWFFTAGENDDRNGHPNPRTTVRYSSDYGATWIAGTKFPFHTTGHIAGFGFTLYVQAFNGDTISAGTGLYRSKDSGKTWVSIDGPTNYLDYRFFVTGCRGEVIYAFDQHGNVYKTTDGGDGSQPQFQLPAAVMNVDSIDACSPRDTLLTIIDLGCDTLLITNASAPTSPVLGIIDPTTGLPPVYPIVIPPEGSGYLKLELNANTAGAYQTKVALEIERAGFVTYDTVTIHSALKFYNPVRLLANVQYDSTSLCTATDSALSIVNDSCFNVQIVNAQMKIGTSFTLDSNFTNDSISAFSIKTFPIRFSPTRAGKIVDSLMLNLLVLGKPVRVSYPISGIGKPDSARLIIADADGNPLPNEINFDTISRCAPSIFAFTITEQGCDSLFVSVEWLDSTKTKRPPFSQFHWYAPPPKWFTNGVVDTSGIEALPAVLGSYQGYLEITDSIVGGGTSLISLIPYKVFVKPGTRTLSLDNALRNYDTIAFCEQKDTVIPIANLGCDTIHDSLLSISGSNFILVNPPKTPFVINPHDTVFLTVRYLPTNSGQGQDTLTIVTDADSVRTQQIPLLGYATPTDTIRFTASTSNTIVIPGDTVTLTVMPGSKFKNKGLHSVGVTLSYNGDIMVPYPTAAPTASTAMAGALTPFVGAEQVTGTKLRFLPIAINGTDMTFDSATPILKMQFRIMLSDSLSTDFHIANFALNGGDNIFNKCLLGATADTGTIGLQFVCGDTEIYNVLRYGNRWTISDGIAPLSGVVHPNPVLEGSAIAVPFTSLRAVVVKIEIMNATGAVVYSGTNSVSAAGTQTFIVPAFAAGSGAYHYRLHPTDGGSAIVTGSFVVIR